MVHIRKFESYRAKKRLDQVIQENVNIVGDVYRVDTTVDIPQSLINSYVKKVKDGLDKDVRKLYSDVRLSEEIVKYLITTGVNLDKIPAGMLFGDTQDQTQSTPQVQAQAQTQTQTEVQDIEQAQIQSEFDSQLQVQDDFEEVSKDDQEDQEDQEDQSVQKEDEEDKDLPI